MEIKKVLDLADHLLTNLESENSEIRKEIDQLRCEIRGLIHMVEVGHIVAAQLGISMASPRIDELILRINDEKTDEPSGVQDL